MLPLRRRQVLRLGRHLLLFRHLRHVWNYAQAFGRLFPDLERDTRERVDLGIALRPTSEIANRGEASDASTSFADGQCGTILRIYREHQMTADMSFLNRVWPRVRTAIEYLITRRDGSDQDGIFEGSQWNTLDSEWFGEIPWISGLYVATLHAGAAMASEGGDTAAGHLGFASRIGPEDFRCAFTAAEGWGSYRQSRSAGRQTGAVEVRHGQVRLSTLAFETATPATAVTVRLAGETRPATFVATGNRTVVTLTTPGVIPAGQTLDLTLTTP